MDELVGVLVLLVMVFLRAEAGVMGEVIVLMEARELVCQVVSTVEGKVWWCARF